MPPIKMLKEPHRMTITVETWIALNPGNDTHQRESLRNLLRGKGLPTQQEWKDGEPVHPVVFKLE